MGKRKRRRLHEVSIEDDIRYRGPLSYQSFQILGWLCIVFTAARYILELCMKMDEGIADSLSGAASILGYTGALSLPLLLIANFSRILNFSEGYKSQLLRTGGAAIGIFLGTWFLFSRYIVGTFSHFAPDGASMEYELMDALRNRLTDKFIAFNIFVDLFLCTLFLFFLEARPKRFFTGKKLILFRMLAILPVTYEIASMVVKGMTFNGQIQLPFWAFPLLTVKPPMTYVVFMILAIHLKARERRFCRHGRSYEEYRLFLNTNRNSWHFSKFLCVLLIITAIADVINMIIMSAITASSANVQPEDEAAVIKAVQATSAMGFGKSIPQLFVAPLMLLYSYNRIPKYKKLSTVIPMIGIGLIVLVALEGIYQVLGAVAREYQPVVTEVLQENPELLPPA